jgi:hypothetical protein
MRYFQITLLFASLAVLTALGCTQSSPAPEESATDSTSPAVTLVNAKCPIMGFDVDEEVTVEWNGKTVGFCCAECIPKWNELSEEEKGEKLAAADSSEAGEMGEMSPDPS